MKEFFRIINLSQSAPTQPEDIDIPQIAPLTIPDLTEEETLLINILSKLIVNENDKTIQFPKY